MTPTSTLGLVALSGALVTCGVALVKGRGDWRTPEVLIPGALVLVTLHWLVPMSDGTQMALAVLSLMISGSGIWQLVRRSGTRSTG